MTESEVKVFDGTETQTSADASVQNLEREEGLDQHTQPLALRVAAEFVGTFLVCFAIYAAYTYGVIINGTNLAFIVLATAFAYAGVTMLFAPLSRVHLNPAVTVAALLTSRTALLDGVLYIVAQVLGSIGAGALVRFLLPTSKQVTSQVWYSPVINGFDKGSVSYNTLNQYGIDFNIGFAIAVEIIAGVIVVATVVNSLAGEPHSHGHGALGIGIAYAVGTAITYPITGASLNPARSTGIAIFLHNLGLTQDPLQQLWVFWIAPVLAAAIVSLAIISIDLFSHSNSQTAEGESAVDDGGDQDEYAQAGDGDVNDDEDGDDDAKNESSSTVNHQHDLPDRNDSTQQ